MNNPFDFFEKIYCINLSYRTDKWKTCQEEFEKLNIKNKVERFDAIKFDGAHPYINIRSAGCCASHRAVIAKAKEENLKNVLILEDDIQFINEVNKQLSLSLEDLNKQSRWDIFYLGMHAGHHDIKRPNVPPLERVDENLLRVNTCQCAHAQGYNSNIFDFILENVATPDETLEWLMRNESIDGWIMRNIQTQGYCFSVNEIIATQRVSYSDNNLVMTRLDQHFVDQFYKHRPE